MTIARWRAQTVGGLLVILLSSLAVSLPEPVAAQESGEQQLIAELCSRGLGETAIQYVRQRRELEPQRDAKAWWFLREMECHAQTALREASGADSRWQACQQVVEQYRSASPDAPDMGEDARWPWLVWQLARCRLLQAQVSLALSLANPANTGEREKALNLVRTILQETDSLHAEIQRRQPLAARQGPSGGSQAPPEQLRNLSADTQLLRCEAILVRSQLYPMGSTDRSAALAEVQVLVRDVLGRAGEDWSMRPAMLLAQATAGLEMGDESALLELEKILADSSAAPKVRLLAGFALARAWAERGLNSQLRSALDSLDFLVQQSPELIPHARLAKVDITLIGLKNQNADDQQRILQSLAQETKDLGTLYGDYWRTRAEALLVSRLSSDQVQESQLAMDLLMAEVRQLTAAGKTEEAVAKLFLARDTQTRQGNGQKSLELTNLAAALLRHLERWDEAAATVEKATIEFRQYPEAPEHHLWAIRARAEVVRKQPKDDVSGKAYRQALVDHLVHWPSSGSCSEVIRWLRDWCLAHGGRSVYLSTLASVLAQQEGQLLSLDKLFDSLLKELLLLSEAARRELAGELERPDRSFASPSVKQSFDVAVYSSLAITEGAGLPVWSSRETLESRQRLLQAWLLQPDSSQLSINQTVSAALAVDQFRMQSSSGSQVFRDLSQLPLDVRLAIAPALVAVMDASSTIYRQTIWKAMGLQAEWTSDVALSQDVEILRRLDSSPVSRAALCRLALMLGDQNQFSELQQIAASSSKNGTVQLMLVAHLTQQSRFPDSIDLATKVAALSQPGSDLHLSARWYLLQAQKLAGQQAEATRSAALILATQPNLNPLWTSRFQLLAQP